MFAWICRHRRGKRGTPPRRLATAGRRDSGHFVSDTGTGRASSVEPRSGCTVDRSVGRPTRSGRGDVGGRWVVKGEALFIWQWEGCYRNRQRHHAVNCFFFVFPFANAF